MEFRIIGIDPGINNCGVAMCTYNTDTQILTVNDFLTIQASILARKQNSKESRIYGNVLPLILLETEIEKIFNTWSPEYIACEDAFYNPRTPNAFISLKNCITSIKRVLYTHKKILYLIAPKLSKMTVVKATANKEDMINAIQKLSDLTIDKSTDNIVEHEADAIGIAYTFIKQIYKNN